MIHPSILSRKKLQEITIALAWSDEEKAKHPHDKLGRFAPKGTTTTSTGSKSGGSGGAQYKRGKQRFTIDTGESEASAYHRVLQTKKEKRLQKQLKRYKQKETARKGFEDWRNQLREEQNVEVVQQAREGEYGTVELAGDVAKEVGILATIQSTRNIGKRVFDKIAKQPVQKLQQQGQKRVKPALGTTERPYKAVDVEKVKHEAKKAAKKAALPWAKVAGGASTPERHAAIKAHGTAQAQKAYKEYTENAFKDLAKQTGTVAVSQAAISTGTKLVGASRWAKLAAPFAGISGAAVRVGGVLLNPAIGIPLAIAGTAAYFHHRKKKREALYAHERELMQRESEEYIPYKTAQDIHREAVAYAVKRYAQQEVETKKRAIDEELSSPHVRSRMEGAARKTARNTANAYSRHESRAANNLMIEFSHAALNKYDESKHPRDKSGRWTASPESNAELIKKTIKKPTSLKTHIASGAAVGAAIGTVNAPGIGTAIGATVGGGLAATRKLTLKKTFEAANHKLLEESMRKHLELGKATPNMTRTYEAFKKASHKQKQRAIETNTLHTLHKLVD